MALSDRTDLLITDYEQRQFPELEESVRLHLQEELKAIETAIASLANAAIQVTDNPPEKPVRGMVRYAVTGWDPLGDGTTGLVVYTGNAWVAV